VIAGDPFQAIRDGCAFVAQHAKHVRIQNDQIEAYAATVASTGIESTPEFRLPGLGNELEERAAFVLLIDAVNFGSGYWPHLRKRPGHSGYRTVEACLLDRFVREGVPAAEELRNISADSCARLFEQEMTPPIDELMHHFARAWNELGALVTTRFGGSYMRLVDAASGDAGHMVSLMLELPMFRDVSSYRGRAIPLLKRAQIVVADLAQALPPPANEFSGLERLTLFADNLIPHVLRIDGLLAFEPALLSRIRAEQLIEAGSREEVEMRACAVHVVELLSQELNRIGRPAHPHELDRWLWQRGSGAIYKADPRPRARSIYY